MSIDTLLQIASFVIVALSPIFLWVVRKWVEEVVNKMREQIDARTNQIQPGYRNGGESLADIAHQVKRVDTRMDDLHEKVNGVARDFEHLRGRFDQHVDGESQ